MDRTESLQKVGAFKIPIAGIHANRFVVRLVMLYLHGVPMLLPTLCITNNVLSSIDQDDKHSTASDGSACAVRFACRPSSLSGYRDIRQELAWPFAGDNTKFPELCLELYLHQPHMPSKVHAALT